jgi:pSer/pThr/pTyr-binding forkhead associated (FHA) protein
MIARLVALDAGRDILIDQDMVVVGRHPSCDARLDSLRLSRHHCYLKREYGKLTVRDLGSTNGIQINGQRVEVGWLRPGDELCIAHLRFRVEQGPDWRPLENGPDPQVPSQPRSWIADLFSQHSRFRFISRN